MIRTINIATLSPAMSEGTWTAVTASNVLSYNRTPGATAATLMTLPLNNLLPVVDNVYFQSGVNTLDVKFSVGVANQDTITAVTAYTVTETSVGVQTATAFTDFTVAGYLNQDSAAIQAGTATASAANVVGIAVGQWHVVITIDPEYNLPLNTELYFVIDQDPAATTTLDYFTATVQG